MKRRHINEYLRSELSTGRIAGTGITEDNYSEEANPKAKPLSYQRPSAFNHEPKHDHGEVITRYKEDRK